MLLGKVEPPFRIVGVWILRGMSRVLLRFVLQSNFIELQSRISQDLVAED
jgi:hypothetical protein